MRLPAYVCLFFALILLGGCSRLGLGGKSISFETVYPAPNQSQVTVHYTLPQAPRGKVYVLWIVNPEEGKLAKAGTLSPGRDQAAQAKVDFTALGAIVSLESSAAVPRPSTPWELKAGQVTSLPSTPSILDITPTTPVATSTPTAP